MVAALAVPIGVQGIKWLARFRATPAASRLPSQDKEPFHLQIACQEPIRAVDTEAEVPQP